MREKRQILTSLKVRKERLENLESIQSPLFNLYNTNSFETAEERRRAKSEERRTEKEDDPLKFDATTQTDLAPSHCDRFCCLETPRDGRRADVAHRVGQRLNANFDVRRKERNERGRISGRIGE